jgi:hypothetical protein
MKHPLIRHRFIALPLLLALALPQVARADWAYEAGYHFAHHEGEAPQGASYNGDLQGLHLGFRENVGNWRGELAGSYQIGSADRARSGDVLESSDDTAWSAEYRIGPQLGAGLWAFGGLAHRRWESEADSAQLERQFTYSPLGLAVALPPAWALAGELTVEYWAVWNVDVRSDAPAAGELPDAGSGWHVSLSLAWPLDEGQSVLVKPYYADWRLDGGAQGNDIDAQVVGINLGLRWR